MTFIAGVSVAIGRTLLDAWALMLMWGWFVVPLGVLPLSYLHALGLDCLIGIIFLCAAPKPPADQNPSDQIAFAAGKGLGVLLMVGAGAIIHGAMA